MEHTFISATVLLVLITDPLGNIPFFISALQQVSPGRRRLVVFRECAIAFGVLLFFMLFGKPFLALLHLTDQSLSVAGGVILFMIAIRMIFPSEGSYSSNPRNPKEPFIVPIAIPLIAGPSAMATVMLIVSASPSKMLEWVAALAITILATMVVFLSAAKLKELLGGQTIQAIERLMGLVLCALAVEMLLGGLAAYLKHAQSLVVL
jgi:MarC family membrane protein